MENFEGEEREEITMTRHEEELNGVGDMRRIKGHKKASWDSRGQRVGYLL